MTIEIHRPELEALILQRMRSGGFHNVEDALMQALETAPAPETRSETATRRAGADLIAAIQRSPCRELEIEPSRRDCPSSRFDACNASPSGFREGACAGSRSLGSDLIPGNFQLKPKARRSPARTVADNSPTPSIRERTTSPALIRAPFGQPVEMISPGCSVK
jgi:hypothetical protein